MTVSEQLTCARSHPLVSAHVTGDPSVAADHTYTLERVLDDLAGWGTVTLANSAQRSPQDPWRCELALPATLDLPARDRQLHADGATQQLAALRCLMEVLSMFDRNERRLHHQLDAVLSDPGA